MATDYKTLREIRLSVVNRMCKHYNSSDNPHIMAEECLEYAAKQWDVSHCGVISVLIDGDSVYYLNLGGIYDETVVIELFQGVAGLHKVTIRSIGGIIDEHLRQSIV